VDKFKLQSRRLPGRTEENRKKPQHGQPIFGHRFKNAGLPEYEAGMLTTRMRPSVFSVLITHLNIFLHHLVQIRGKETASSRHLGHL
jgi:hypothetical protein